jgi:minor extracellular serine protease Vpr
MTGNPPPPCPWQDVPRGPAAGRFVPVGEQADVPEREAMNRRLGAVLAIAALIVAGVMPATAVAASPPSRQFTRLDASKIDQKLVPAILANKPVTVMLQMKGAPATTRKVSKAQQVAVAKQLKVSQDAIKGRIAKAGGRVLGQYQYAYNGIKVRIAGRRIAALMALPGVIAVRGIATHTIDNVHSVPFTGAPQAWADLGVTGAGQTIAVIDTGIDYEHANFGGPGTVDAFKANDPTVLDADSPFPTAKVIAGTDFAGDGYDASGDEGSPIPTPDPDPLDCFGHGSHVAGTAAGDGVLSTGETYSGPYDATTYATNSFAIGPGVAPQAKLVALKVFGCAGSTDLVVDALNWVGQYNATHADAIDVVNMSLGSPFGRADNPDAAATSALVDAGVVVVASAGNSGPSAYITGSPASTTKAISVAAEDTLATFPGAIIDFATAADITNANNQNAYPNLPVSGTLKVIKQTSGALSLGCKKEDYGTLAPNTIVAIQRGTCAFVDKGAAAQAAGAIGIIDINRDDLGPTDLPTFIGYNPEIFDIPMVGTGNGSKAAIIAADGQGVTLQPGGTVNNPTFKQITSFSSGGPRNGDSAAKPDVAAPGNSIVSTLVGSGNKGTTLSGTSMASPHVAGIAALVHAANPGWAPLAIKAAIVGTASAASTDINPYNVRTAGSGAVQARKAVDTVGYATTPDGTASLSYGYDPTGAAYSEPLVITLHNTSAAPITYNLTGASIVSVSPSSVTVGANSTATVTATAALTVGQLASTPFASNNVALGSTWGGVNTFRGAVVATPTTSGAGIYSLRVPFIAVPRALSNVAAGTRSAYTGGGVRSATIPLSNSGIHASYADVYAWGLSDPQDLPATPIATNDIRAVGVQVLPTKALTGVEDANDRALIFAVNTWGKWSSASSNEFDIAIYGTNKTKPDYFVVGVDFGAVTNAGTFDGRMAAFTITAGGDIVDIWVADAPANGSTVLLPTLASEIGQNATNNTRFSYGITGFSVEDSSLVDPVAGQAELDPFHPALSTGDFVPIGPGGSASLSVSANRGLVGTQHPKGWMIVTLDDANGAAQADLVPVGTP